MASISPTRRSILTAAAALGLGMASFAGIAAQDATPAATAPCSELLGVGAAGEACVNIIHASPDAPAVDIFVNDMLAVENLEFGNATGYVALPAGDHNVKVAPHGEAADAAVIDADVTLEADQAYEVAAVGQVADIAPAIFPVDLAALESMDEAAVRVIHASPDAPAVDVAVKDGDILIENLAFPDASDYLMVPAASYDLEVRPTGTTDVALDLAGVELEAGKAYSVYAIGTLADETLTVLPIVSGAPEAEAEATPSA
jgi:hypothetical protein